MSIYYEHAGVTLYLGDCLEVMPQLQAGSIDAIIADLPYGTTACDWDSVIPLAPLWEQYKRLIKPNGAIVLTASQPFTSVLVMSNIKWFRYEWIWRKEQGTGHLNSKIQPLRNHESVLVFYADQPVYNAQKLKAAPYRPVRSGRGSDNYGSQRPSWTVNDGTRHPLTVLDFMRDAANAHSTAKPVALFEYLIATYTNPGELVLDNTAGSGTTLRAAKNLGRRAIGIEQRADFCAVAARRMEQEVMALGPAL